MAKFAEKMRAKAQRCKEQAVRGRRLVCPRTPGSDLRFFGDELARLLSTSGDYDFATVLGEHPDAPKSDALRTTGDNGDFILKFHGSSY